MERKSRKILAYGLKILFGIICFYFIYRKLSTIPDFKLQSQNLLQHVFYYAFIIAFILMPVNWGIECYKWKLTSSQIEPISYKTAVKSVFAGICAGNLAPGRAIEFLAKIVFFKIENRPAITVLHFINGMFQMLITVLMGIISISYKLSSNQQSLNIVYMIIIIGILLIIFFCWSILNVHFIQKKLKFIKWFQKMDNTQNIHFTLPLISKLLLLSILRYLVFTSQFYFIYHALCPQTPVMQVFMSISAYFMITSAVPMISYIEPAIRAAIALFVFNNPTDVAVSVVLASTFVWIINVVVPSIIGYIVIFREKIEFRTTRAN